VVRLVEEEGLKFIENDKQEEVETIKCKIPYYTYKTTTEIIDGKSGEKRIIEIDKDIINAKFEDAVIKHSDETIDNLINHLKENGETYYLTIDKFLFYPATIESFLKGVEIEHFFYFAKKK